MKSPLSMKLPGKKVLLRVDFNTPLKEENGEMEVADDTKIKAALPTINYLIARNCSEITLATHLGKPEGKVVPELSVEPAAKRLAELLGLKLEVDRNVPYVGKKFFFELPPDYSFRREFSMLENLRFWPEEEADPESKEFKEFAKNLVNLGGIRKDVFVQDAFPCCHRKHASIVIPSINLGDSDSPEYIPSCAGFLVGKEIYFLSKLLTNPERPFVVVLGGAKVSDKLGLLENLLDKADLFLIGGAMAYTLLRAKGYLTGDSKVEESELGIAREFLEKAADKIILPHDHVTAKTSHMMVKDKETVLTLHDEETDIPKGFTGVDIGFCTRGKFIRELKKAKTIFWNGPLGIAEILKFSKGTGTIANFLKIATERGATTVVGGGDTITALKKTKCVDISDMTFVSTGGGASLEFLARGTLPGIDALEEK